MVHATQPLRGKCYVIHNMDDILLAHQDPTFLNTCLKELKAHLAAVGLTIAPDKVQQKQPFSFLGYCVTELAVPIAPQIKIPMQCTL